MESGEGAEKTARGGKKATRDCQNNRMPIGSPVQTACGGQVHYHPDLPCSMFRGEVVFFCLPACKEDFEKAPRFSCLAARLWQEES